MACKEQLNFKAVCICSTVSFYCCMLLKLVLLLAFFVGSLTVISAKAVSSMINITLSGYSQLGHPLFYVMLIVMITTAIAQVK